MLETYGIFEYREVSVTKLIVLTKGLRENSRVKIALSGGKSSMETMLAAATVDLLGILVWSKTRSAQNNSNKPKSLVELLLKGTFESDNEVYDSSEEYEKAREKILRGEV